MLKSSILTLIFMFLSTGAWAKYEYLSIGQPIHVLLTSETGADQNQSRSQRWRELSQLASVYNLRFSVGERERDAFRSQYVQLEEALFKKWSDEKALIHAFEVHNDVKKSLIISLSSLRDEDGAFMGFVMTKSQYSDFEDRSLFHVLSINALKGGMSFFGVGEMVACRARLLDLVAGKGRIAIEFARDLKKQEFGALQLSIFSTDQGWSVIDPESQRVVHRVLIETWMNIFSFNGGVTRIFLDSRDGCKALNTCT